MQESNWVRVSKDSHCPICGKPDWCTVTADGMIACCMRVEAEKQAHNGGWIHYLADKPKPSFISHAPKKNNHPKAEPKVLDKVYSAMLNRLTLSRKHRQELLSPKRGMTQEQIKQNDYRSLPLRGRAQIAKDLTQLFGPEVMTKVPGFYLNPNGGSSELDTGYYPTLAGAPGLLIPIRDVQQRITACQIKVDRAGGKAGQDMGKYTWFSSKSKEGGTSSGAPAHVAMPSDVIDWQRVWITEGALKADIAAELLGETVIGVAGVSNWRCGQVLNILEQLDAKDVVIAYDADDDKNPHVKHHAFQLACACNAKGYTVYQAQWELHQGKGIDDLLLNGEVPEIQLWRTKNRIQKLDAEFMAAVMKPKTIKISLQEARQKHYQKIRALIENHQPGIHAFTSVVGTGKTNAAMTAIKDLFREGKWPTVKRKRKNKKTGKYYYRDEPLRLVFVTDNHAAYQQWLNDSELKDIIEIQQGRSPDETSDWYCERFDECHRHGATRHNPMVDVCQECLLRHATLVGDRMMEYWQCPYLQSMEKVKAAKVVFTSKASIFNASRELKEFDLIIVDEDLFSSLWEIVALNTDNLNDYLSGMDYLRSRSNESENSESIYSQDDDFRVFINLLKEVMATPVTEYNWRPIVPLLQERAQQNSINLQELLDSLLQREVHYQTRRYDFETPFSLHDKKIYPLRLMRDLIEMLAEEINRPPNADTRLWLTAQGLKLYIPRQHLIDIIQRGKTLINLDATPNILLQMMFPKIQWLKYDVPEYLHITQVTNSLYTKSNIAARDYANLRKINVALEQITQDKNFPVIFCHKDFDPQTEGNRDNPNVFAVRNPKAGYGHFDYETRAFNGYAQTDVLCIVGHYSHPINHLRALAQAVRNSDTAVRKRAPTQILRPYWHRNEDGSGLGRWLTADKDPLVQELIQHSEEAIYTQAIGRGRAALRSADNPLQVYLITATPIESLRIDKLVRLSDLTKIKPNRQKFYQRRDELNRKRQKTAYQKVVAAIKQLLAQGKKISLNAIEKLCGVKRTLIVKLRRQILGELDLQEKIALPTEDAAETKGAKRDVKMGILAGREGVTTVGYNINNTPQWTPPTTPDKAVSQRLTTKAGFTNLSENAPKKPIVSCDNLDQQPKTDFALSSSDNESITPAIDSDLAAWARKKHGFSFAKLIRAYEAGVSLEEPIKLGKFDTATPADKSGLIVEDFCAFVGDRLAKVKDLDMRLPRLSGAVLEYANRLRVEAMEELYALNKIIAEASFSFRLDTS